MHSKRSGKIIENLLVIAFIAVGTPAIVGGIYSRDLPLAALGALLVFAVGLFICERFRPFGGRVLFKLLVNVEVPGITRFEVRPSPTFTRGRLFVIFDKTESFYNGIVRITYGGIELAAKKLRKKEGLRAYNRSLWVASDRVYIDVRSRSDPIGVMTVELDLDHNVTDPALRARLHIVNSPQFELVLRAK